MPPPSEARPSQATSPRVAITGASGFLGSALAAALKLDGADVRRVRRAERAAEPDIAWLPDKSFVPKERLEGLDAVINLAGEPIARRWTEARKRAIRESRVLGTTLLTRAISELRQPPRVLLSGSAIGIYGDRGDEELDEESAAGSDFLATTAVEWERAAESARLVGTRLVLLRTGIVLNPGGGALEKMILPFKLAFGGPIGTGKQWMSWIALSDWVRATRFLLTAELDGPVNLVAPNPVPNAEFAATLARVLGRPALARVPVWAIEALFGEMGRATLLASARVHPRRLTAAGFEFATPTLEQALRAELAKGRTIEL